ncbi:putative phage protein [Ralstonia solanacearum K60]|nr:putative phage protein [Ralstonia solanacearum K60]
MKPTPCEADRTRITRDRALINDLGGPAKVARLLDFDPTTGTQRVHNWTIRGIPSAVKLGRPDLFLTPATASAAVVVNGPS